MDAKDSVGNQETAVGDGEVTPNDYDLLPYLSLPIAYTQPNTLSALATLHGQFPPTVSNVRVLELGCASGNNLIPLAVRFPDAHFLGIDLSAQQVANGNSRIAELGLANISLVCRDIASTAFPPASFEYVICHGVYSWVPPVVQDAIFRVIGHCLTTNGVAAVSYNTLPGWHLRNPVRDILIAHAGSKGSPQERVARARDILKFLEVSAGSDAYGALLRDEAKRMARMPSSYILGEFLAEHNAPTSFLDFTNRAAQHGLGFVCEADCGAGARALLDGRARQQIGTIAGSDRRKTEHYLDLISGRPFRRSILMKSSAGGTIGEPRIEGMNKLHIACKLTPDVARSEDLVKVFRDRQGREISTRVDFIARSFLRLANAYPATLPVSSLTGTGADAPQIATALLQMVLEGRAAISAVPITLGQQTDKYPEAWSYARAEAARGLPFVTNLHHVAVAISKTAAAVMSKLDGAHTQDSIVDWLARAITAGTITLPEVEQESIHASGENAATSLAERLVKETIRFLSASAVLAPEKKSS